MLSIVFMLRSHRSSETRGIPSHVAACHMPKFRPGSKHMHGSTVENALGGDSTLVAPTSHKGRAELLWEWSGL